MRAVSLFLLTVCVVLAAGCNAQLKVPMAAKVGQELPVTGYGYKMFGSEDDFRIGSYEVGNIERDLASSIGVTHTSSTFGRSTTSTWFSYDVRAQGRKLTAECQEDVVTLTPFLSEVPRVHFDCTCMEGSTQRSTLGYDGLTGTVNVGANRFEISALIRLDNGLSQASPVPGYQFRTPQVTGAIDKRGERAWIPQTLNEDDRIGLICSYAGMFLYRSATD